MNSVRPNMVSYEETRRNFKLEVPHKFGPELALRTLDEHGISVFCALPTVELFTKSSTMKGE